MKILIADNHFLIRKSLQMIVKDSWPYAYIETVSNSRELAEKALHENWTIIISDVNMRDLPGFKALKKIKEAKAIPIIITSLNTNDLYKIQSLQLGAAAYLDKSQIADKLEDTIRNILNGRIGGVNPINEILTAMNMDQVTA